VVRTAIFRAPAIHRSLNAAGTFGAMADLALHDPLDHWYSEQYDGIVHSEERFAPDEISIHRFPLGSLDSWNVNLFMTFQIRKRR
jgi:hypothetical protein